MTDPQDSLARGIALFNAGHFFDAHEALEDAWRAATADTRLFLQGLTQTAVALHHDSTGNRTGARSVLTRALRNLEPYAPTCLDIDVARLLRDLRPFLAALGDAREAARPKIHLRG